MESMKDKFINKAAEGNGDTYAKVLYDIFDEYGIDDQTKLQYTDLKANSQLLNAINSAKSTILIDQMKKSNKTSKRQFFWICLFNLVLIVINISLLAKALYPDYISTVFGG